MGQEISLDPFPLASSQGQWVKRYMGRAFSGLAYEQKQHLKASKHVPDHSFTVKLEEIGQPGLGQGSCR